MTFKTGRIDIPELLDQPGQSPEDVAASLRDVRQVNRFLAGVAVTRKHLARMIQRLPKGSEVTVLDLATGSGDIPRAVLRWARKHGIRLRYTGLDVNPAILQVAREQCREYPEIDFIEGDARQTHWEHRRFDFVTCSMALHHFDPEEAVRILREMDRLSARGFVVNDLRRSRIAWALIWLLTRLLRANRLTRHDGPASTLRAYTPTELRALVLGAGLSRFRIHRHLFFRMALVVEKAEDESP